MIFHSISFHQYRCFPNGSVEFSSSEDYSKSITLILAPNGSGKTELLFAFWWVLYGFDFSTLINKEDTPYSLNSEVYRKLLNGSVGEKDYCAVKLVFENEGTTYTVLKKEIFEKGISKRKLRTSEEVEFSTIDENGVSSTPIRRKDEIEKLLDKIIPQRVLNGIIFDGERMQKISSADEKSVKSIQGVINDVTNQDFIRFYLDKVLELSREYNSELRKIANAGGNQKLTHITNDLDRLGSEISSLKNTKQVYEQRERELENRLTTVTDLLKNSTETRENIIKLELKKSEKTSYNKMLIDKTEDLFGELSKFGFTLAIDKLLDSAEEIIMSYNIPVGLTVNTVSKIMLQEKCICGTPFSNEMIDTLKKLQKLLPPDNLNAVLKEEIVGLRGRNNETKKNLQRIWKDIKEAEKKEKECQSEIEYLSSKIGNYSDDSRNLENERKEIDRELGRVSTHLKELPIKIDRAERQYESLQKQKREISKSIGIKISLQKKCDFIEKCRKALMMLQERFRLHALNEINEYLQQAYSEITEDFENGRQVYITRYTGNSYRIVNYYVNHIEEYMKNADWTSLSSIYNLKLSDMTDEIRKEIAIIENAVSKSTGQSKSVTIAFVKAILDYSSTDKIDDEFQIKKIYPLVIDAPFSDLSGENLTKPAQELNKFSTQVILFLSPSSYETVNESIDMHIGKRYRIVKLKDKNCSYIEREE